MVDIVDTQTISTLIKNIGEPLNPTVGMESLDVLEQWIVDPILVLEPEQRILIENALRKHNRL